MKRGFLVSLGLVIAMVLAAAPALAGSGAEPAAERGARTVVFRGDGVNIHRASGDLDKLSQTDAAFRAFTKKKLNQLWGWTDNDPDCATAPLVVVKRWRSDGWAQITNMGVFAQPSESCAQGGHWEIWAIKGDKWQTVLGGQEVPTCAQLRRKQVPEHFASSCYNGHDQVVHYTGP